MGARLWLADQVVRVGGWALDRLVPVDPDPAMLARSGGVRRCDSVEGDDLWIAEQQVQWWLEVGQHLRAYATHQPECRATDDRDARCSCGLLDVLCSLDEVVACTLDPLVLPGDLQWHR
jgi:hypothetical protein